MALRVVPRIMTRFGEAALPIAVTLALPRLYVTFVGDDYLPGCFWVGYIRLRFTVFRQRG